MLVDIIETVLELKPGELSSSVRRRKYVLGRRVFYALIRHYYKEHATFTWLGQFFGQDHATVMHAIDRHTIEIDQASEHEYQNLFKEISDLFHPSVRKTIHDNKGKLIRLLREKYRKRIALETEINDLEQLITTLDKKTQQIG